MLLVVFALVCAEFSDVDSGGRVPVRNAVIQRVRVDCRKASFLRELRPDRCVLWVPEGISQ